ncbi:unnamed protein product [Symbiodinium microadriaticum]|nr:unnamed protein product [Symbiodinium sp. KB8]CAE7355700.1 unnamed protein product [Symbiodinium microadriaticum]
MKHFLDVIRDILAESIDTDQLKQIIKVILAKLTDLAVGKCYEVKWGNGHKVIERKAFQWMLEQLGGIQFRHFSLTSEKKRTASQSVLAEFYIN